MFVTILPPYAFYMGNDQLWHICEITDGKQTGHYGEIVWRGESRSHVEEADTCPECVIHFQERLIFSHD